MGNSSGKLAKQKSADLFIGTGLVLSSYAFILFAIALWGYVILPKNCLNDKIRSSGRTALITACVMFTVYMSYSMCKANCLSWVEGDKKVIYDEDKDPRTPSTLLVFTMITSALYAASIADMQKNLNNDKSCQSGGHDTWNMGANISYLFIGAGILVPFITFFYRWRVDSDEARRERARRVAGIQLQEKDE